MASSSINQHDNCVELTYPTGEHCRLPYLWLRDNCQCDDCRISQTAEKRFILASVPVDLAPATAMLVHGELYLVWPDGHETSYNAEFLRELKNSDEQPPKQWADNFLPCRVDFDRFIRDDEVARDALEQFVVEGAMVLANGPRVAGTLEALAPRLGPIRELLFARIHDVKVDPRGYNVAHTSFGLPPHNDFASYSWPPSVQALHMLVNDTPGGETIIVDAWAVAEAMRTDQPELFAVLCTKRVPFREFDETTETYAREPMIKLDSAGNISAVRFSNQLMQTVNPNEADVALFYRAYHELCTRICDPANKVVFRLHGGEILIVAAHRVLHAREPFEPIAERHLQDAYFELDHVINHLSVLNRRGR